MLPVADRMSQEMDGNYIRVYEANRISDLVEWLNCLFPELRLPLDAAEVELREILFDGTVLCGILGKIDARFMEECQDGDEYSIEQDNDNIRRFLSAINEMRLPTFNVSDLEQGSISAVIECLLCLRDHLNLENGKCYAQLMNSNFNGGSLSRKRWEILDTDRSERTDNEGGHCLPNGESSPFSTEERRKNFLESKVQHIMQMQQSPITSEASAAPLHHVEDKFHEVFQLKQELHSDISATNVSEMMQSNSLDSASTQSLMNIVNRTLDESAEKKNGELPHRVAYMLRKVVQEIEQRISSQALHIHHLNNLIKTREDKYQARIKVLETVANGLSEEIQIAKDQLQQIKSDKLEIEDRKKEKEQDIVRLIKEKEYCDTEIAELKKEMKINMESYAKKCIELETKSKEAKLDMEERIKNVESRLAESRERIQELEAFSELRDQKWNKKEHIYQNFVGFLLQSLGDLRVVSSSIRKEMAKTHKTWEVEFAILAKKLKGITDAAENYHAVLAENRRLYNEVQDLKGNIRVYCRIRPFLPGQNGKLTSIDYIGENGELLITNPFKQGKDGHRMFKFNKVFGPAVSQEEVFLDTQPLIRSVLDGYNICIFAYGQTGSGKTYTMSGPNASSKEYWGVNYRALNDLFQISHTRRNTCIYEVGVQMVEIYNEQVRDLLSNDSSTKRLGIWSTSQPNGLAVPDASMHSVKSTSDVLELMQIGQTNRAVGATALNERSSRSHSILTVHVRGMDLESGATLRGCLHLVDLAGSERVDRSEATGDRLKEAQHINKSLSALGDVIYALAQKSPHVPYRNSKLTQVLQSSLGGQAKTLMFVHINPDAESYLETISTLKFAERVSGVELGAARSNKEGKDISNLMEQVASLKDAVARKDEEIQRLQLLKDLKTQSSNLSSNNHTTKSTRKSFFPSGRPSLGTSTQRGRKFSGRSSTALLTDKAASDLEACSEYSDKHSESGSLPSVDDFKQQKETYFHTKPVFTDSQDIELLGFGDGDSEERLSDISDSGLSMGTETDGSINSVVEHMLFPEVEKPTEHPKDKKTKVPSRVPRPSSKKFGHQAFSKSKLKGTPSSSRKFSTGQVTFSSRPPRRWQ